MGLFKMTDSQQTVLSVTFTDKKGQPVPAPAGKVSYLTDNPALLALTQSDDGASCTVAAVGPLGTATVSVKVANDAGDTIASGTLDIEIDPGAPTNIVINAATPTELP